MNKEYNFLYKYLEKLKIFIVKNEFEIQIQSHPDCPSLLAITDILCFFNIENGVLQIDSSQIELLPDSFVTILNEKNKDVQFYFIEKKGEKYTYEGSTKNSISKTELESQWSGIVLLIEKSEINEISKLKSNKWFLGLPLSISALVTIITSLFKENTTTKLFFLLPTIIFIFSITALQKLLIERKELKKIQVKGNELMRNYHVFKNNLLTSTTIQDDLPQSATILIGNTEAKLKIILVTNPFSGHCKEAHLIMEEILQNYFDLVCFDIRFNFNSNEYSSKKSKKIHQHLVALYHHKGQKGFIDGISNWFKDNDENKLYSMQEVFSEEKINKILSNQFNFNMDNELIFTPQFIINNYRFPRQYDQKVVLNFIKDLSEDECLK